ncbi:Uncharacterised protein [uncultured archaeon]|nr:Uncharacterised protein [uncultured archaeon]
MNEARKLDRLDIELLRAVIEQPNKSIIVDVIAPFLGRLSQQALRNRLAELEKEGLIISDRSRSSRSIFLKPTRKGRRLVSNSDKLGHEEAQNSKEGGPLGL